MKVSPLAIILAGLLGLWESVTAQVPIELMATNRLEYARQQGGHTDRFDNWLDGDLWLGASRLGFRLEIHQGNPAEESQERLSQRFLEYRHEGLRIRIGNFYEKIGQGLLFQAFELQNLVLDRVERSLVLDRNADGVWIEWMGNRVEGRLFSARPLGPFGTGRADVVRGLDANVWLWDRLKVGGSALRWNPPSWKGISQIGLWATRAQWISGPIVASVEYAWSRGPHGPDFQDGQALYGSLTLTGSGLGLSVEWKDYRHFNLPFNNPPTLVPIHSVTLLNRHTHVLRAEDEKGFQLEGTFAPVSNLSFVLNLNGASNHISWRDSRYWETYFEARYEVLGRWMGRIILDQAEDRLIGEKSRRTLALEFERYVSQEVSLFGNLQIQRVRRLFGPAYWNRLVVLSFSRSPGLSVAVQADYSSNPTERRRILWATTLSLTIRGRHQVTVMGGGRRAGLACSGGICVLMPEFRGIELRISSHL